MREKGAGRAGVPELGQGVPHGSPDATDAGARGGAVGETHQSSMPPDQKGKSGAADMQSFIGRQLRAVYDDVAKQPVPDRFLELMKQLELKTAND